MQVPLKKKDLKKAGKSKTLDQLLVCEKDFF